MQLNIAVVPGDGIGPEVTNQAIAVLRAVAQKFGHTLKHTTKNIGGAALVASGDPLPPDTLDACLSADAVLLGAVGGPAFDSYPRLKRPEAGLLRLRQELGAYANLRPAVCYAALETSSPLRADVVHGTNIMIVRELLGGLYFGQPRSLDGEPGARVAILESSHGATGASRRRHGAARMTIRVSPQNAGGSNRHGAEVLLPRRMSSTLPDLPVGCVCLVFHLR